MAPHTHMDPVQVCVLTALDGFAGEKHPFFPDQDLPTQVGQLCTSKQWCLDTGQKCQVPVILHGATDFIVTQEELLTLPAGEETRLSDAAFVFNKVWEDLNRDPDAIGPLEVVAHNARPGSFFLQQAVQKGVLERVVERHPVSSRQWEAVLGCMCCLLDHDDCRDWLQGMIESAMSTRVTEIALQAFDEAQTPLAASFGASLLRVVLSFGEDGLNSIYRAEADLRAVGLVISFARTVVNAAVRGEADALQLINDALAQCNGPSLQRFEREVTIEVKAIAANDPIVTRLLTAMPAAERCVVAIRFAADSEMRIRSGAAAVAAAQSTREQALWEEVAELRARLKNEETRSQRALNEVRRLNWSLRELVKFAEISPATLRESVQEAVVVGWSGITWHRQYTALHVAAELGRSELLPLLLSLGADPSEKDYKDRTALDVARQRGHPACIVALEQAAEQGTQEMSFEPPSEGLCVGLRKWLALVNWRRKNGLKRLQRPPSEAGIELGGTTVIGGTVMTVGGTVMMDESEEAPAETGLEAMDNDKLNRFARLLNNLSEDLVAKRLRAPPSLGGLSLTEDEVKVAMDRVAKIAQVLKAEEEPAPAAPAKGKGKGKGAPPPPKSKGKGKGAAHASSTGKKKFQPSKSMKPLWWNKYSIDPGKTTKTVWDNVPDFLEQLTETSFVDLFSKGDGQGGAVRNRLRTEDVMPLSARERRGTVTSAPDLPTAIRIVKDPQLVVAKEAAMKALPKPVDVAQAIYRLDAAVLTKDRIQRIRDHACPSREQLAEMKAARAANPTAPWALPESYMWEVGQIPLYQPRLQCFMCLQSYEENLAPVQSTVCEIIKACQDVRSSAAVREFLGCVLACGNYLNGGTNRGQADGFDLEQLAKLHLVKDNEGRDLRYFISAQLSPGGQFESCGPQLFEDLAALLQLVKRRVARTSEGTDVASKQLRASMEDLDQAVRNLRKEFDETDELLRGCLQEDLDPTDPMRFELPQEFQRAKVAFENTKMLLESAKAEYKQVQTHFVADKMPSEQFFLLWDEALLPGDILALPAKAAVARRICVDGPVHYKEFVDLWDWRPAESRAKGREIAASASSSAAAVGQIGSGAAVVDTAADSSSASTGGSLRRRREGGARGIRRPQAAEPRSSLPRALQPQRPSRLSLRPEKPGGEDPQPSLRLLAQQASSGESAQALTGGPTAIPASDDPAQGEPGPVASGPEAACGDTAGDEGALATQSNLEPTPGGRRATHFADAIDSPEGSEDFGSAEDGV
mmetsp:Transcript_12751/g.31697  ORF Transcript_12751/g.31697 Transcript_12751/m.31697 type:complete len:1262 (+) Transcript_12751:44-3829(+)